MKHLSCNPLCALGFFGCRHPVGLSCCQPHCGVWDVQSRVFFQTKGDVLARFGVQLPSGPAQQQGAPNQLLEAALC